MPTFTRQERLAEIQKVGFPDPLKALAVSLAEFGENRDVNAQSQSDYVSGGVREPSFGPWQIHLPSHPDVVQSCAMDLRCSTEKAFQISNGGTDFGPWSAYTNGSYKGFLSELETQFKDLITLPTPVAGDTGPAGPPPGPGATPKPGFDTAARGLAGGVTKGLQTATLPKDQPIVDVPAAAGKAVSDATGNLSGIPAALKGVQDSFRSENLWRAAFIVVGAGAVFLGGRLYLSNPDGVREAA